MLNINNLSFKYCTCTCHAFSNNCHLCHETFLTKVDIFCVNITQALEYLSEIQEHINEVRQQNESTCRDINQLLNKPWPGKTSPASSSLAGTQEEGSRGPASAPEHSTNDNVFSVEEQSMLAEVDGVLAQAQKLRQFQSKVSLRSSCIHVN